MGIPHRGKGEDPHGRHKKGARVEKIRKHEEKKSEGVEDGCPDSRKELQMVVQMVGRSRRWLSRWSKGVGGSPDGRKELSRSRHEIPPRRHEVG